MRKSGMEPFSRSIKGVAACLLTVAVLVIGIFNVSDRAAWRDPSDGIFWIESGSGLQAAEVEPGSPGERAGIKRGDILATFDGKRISNLGEYSDELYRLGAGRSVWVGIRSGNDIRELPVELASKSLLRTEDGFRIILAFLHITIGIFVVARGGRWSRAFHFYGICLAAFVLYLFSYTPKWTGLDQIVFVLSVAALLILPAMFVHFCLRFPLDPQPVRSRAPLLYAPAALLGAGQVLWMTGHLAGIGLPLTAGSSAILDRIHLIYLCSGLLAGGVILWHRKLRAQDLIVRQQMKWVSYGTLAGTIPFFAIYGVPYLFGFRPNFVMLASQMSLGLIPLGFAYALIHFRLLDVEMIARRSASYLGAGSLLLAPYLIFVLVLGRWLRALVPDADWMVIGLAALGIAVLFAPLRNSIQNRLDRIFYKEQFEPRAGLVEFARTLGAEISLPHLAKNILERISETFKVGRLALFVADPACPGMFRVAGLVGFPEADNWRIGPAEIGGGTPGDGLAGRKRSLQSAVPALSSKGIQWTQDLDVRGRRIGLIGLGALPPDRHFSSEDTDLLEALARYAAIALDNANLYRSIESKAVELERLKSYTENILESINIAVIALDSRGKVASCNHAFEELYQIGREQAIGMDIADLLGSDVIASIQKAVGAAGWDIRSVGNIFKQYLRNRNGRSLIANVSMIPLPDSSHAESGCLIVMDDITEKIQLEGQLLQAEKLSSLGLLAAGIAHEVNTPITGISSCAQMLLKTTPEGDVRKPLLEKIEKQTFRAAEIVNGLLNFARMNGAEYADLDIDALIRESLALLEHAISQNRVTIEYAPGSDLPKIYGNAGKLQQVFVNLFLNARDAMPSGGSLRIETSKNDTMVVVDISDSGSGISPENIRKIFDPFFTTKSTGKGTGLGLAVAYGIIQEHGGRIFVDSIPEQGTHFQLKLPTRQAARA
jgi:PAS domain S-box-containing protein